MKTYWYMIYDRVVFKTEAESISKADAIALKAGIPIMKATCQVGCKVVSVDPSKVRAVPVDGFYNKVANGKLVFGAIWYDRTKAIVDVTHSDTNVLPKSLERKYGSSLKILRPDGYFESVLFE